MPNINDAMLRALRPPASGRIELRDDQVRGLMVRLTKAGVLSWSIRQRTADGRHSRPTLGTWPAVGVAEARKRALATISAMQAGADPVSVRRQQRATRAAERAAPVLAAPTVRDRLAQWRSAMRTRWSESYNRDIGGICRREIEPRLGDRTLADTTRENWTDLVAAKRAKSAAAGANLLRTISSFLGHAEAHGWLAAPLLPRKAARMIAPAVPPRERALSDDELVAVWFAAGRETPRQRCFIRLLVLTAARRSEVADIAGDELDLAQRRWTIPATRAKNNHALTVPLGPLALSELRAVLPNEPTPGKLLGRDGRGLNAFSKLKTRIDAASGVRDWGWHDLRRSARSGMARLGVPREAAEAALNHLSGQSRLERVYNRHDFAPEIIAALSAWQTHVATLLAGRSETEALPIKPDGAGRSDVSHQTGGKPGRPANINRSVPGP